MGLGAGSMLGRYKLIEELGSGSFGSVWLGEDTWLSKKVALKIPHNQKMDASKLLAEPKLLAALEHPNIVRLLTVERIDETMFMVIEFVEGRSLRDRLAKGPVPLPEAVEIARAILEALAHAHAKGVVHRDLKPANILLTEQGLVKITDFGTAHALHGGEETVAAGTLFYMPKEQLLGRVMPASDLYAVGVILFEMLTGKLPFHDDVGARVIQKILSNEPAPEANTVNKAVPPELSAIVRRALDRDLTRRYRKAEDFLEALDAWKEGRAIPEAASPPPVHPAYDQFSRKVARLAETMGVTHEFAYRGAWGRRGKGDGEFLLPVGIAVSGAGSAFVTDAIRCQVQVFDRQGRPKGRLGTEGTVLDRGLVFHNPTAIAVSADERLFVCDTKNCRVQVFNPEGELLYHFGRPLVVLGLHEEQGVIGFNYPRGLALDEAEGLVYVADTGNNRIRLFNTEGTPVQTFGGRGERAGEFDAPIGLAVGAEGRLYVADSQNCRIQVFDRGFRFVEAWGHRGTLPGEFSHPPTGIALTVNGEAVVCDDTERMQVFGASGAHIGTVTGPQGVSPVPKYYGAAFAESEELLAVDENGCQVHQFALKEKSG